MLMFFIMLPCYLIVTGAYAYTLNYASKPNGYILLGVKLPKEEMNRPEIQQMVKKYKKHSKYMVLGMLLTILGGLFLSKFPMISTIYCLLWTFGWLLGMQILLNKTFDEVYTYKKEQGWIVGETYTISVDTEVARLKSQFLCPKWHWLIIAIITIIGCLLWAADEWKLVGFIYGFVNIAGAAACFLIYCIIPKVKTNIYSENSEINVALNRSYCYEMSRAMVWAGYINAVCWLIGGFFPEPEYNIGVIITVVIVSTTAICAVLFYGMYKVRKERNLFNHIDSMSIDSDDDIYWRGGSYCNPNDPKVFVEKRIGFGMTMNMARPAGKVMNVIAAASIIACFIPLIYNIPLDFPSLSLSMDANTIYVNATQYDTTIKLDEITEAKVIDKRPKLYKNNGMNTDQYDFGQFRAKDYGQSHVYINKDVEDKYLLIYVGEKIYLINSDKEEELDACIQELKRRGVLTE